MKTRDFPALFGSADAASNSAQRALLLLYKANATLLALAAIVALVSIVHPAVAILSAVLFLLSLSAHVFSHYRNFQGRWYRARALAESIKTSTWRLMMAADPFSSGAEQENLERFRSLLRELLSQSKGVEEDMDGAWANGEQITEQMLNVMRQSFEEKKNLYLTERIDEQRTWYAEKAQVNRTSARSYLIALAVLYFLAILLLLISIAAPEIRFLPVEVLAVIASSVIGWTQLKRFDELASAYTLTAHELGIVRSRYTNVDSAVQLAAFVSDAENAFSREHTKWAARRDH